MPYRSPGCHTCKIRRIKCDGTKPVCQRCAKSHRICLDENTVNQSSILIHDENRYASGRVKRPRGPRTSLSSFRPYLDLQSRALEYYVNFHLRTLDGLSNIASCLPESVRIWNMSGKICGMVDLALSAMALAVFSRTQRHSQAAIQASANYDRVLKISQGILARLPTDERLAEQHIDACLLTALILIRYEDSMYHPPEVTSGSQFNSLQSWFHHDGAMAILKVWIDDPKHRPATRIMAQARRGLIKSCLIRNLPLPHWIQDGIRFGEDGLGLKYDRIAVRIVNLRQSYQNLLNLGSEHKGWLKSIRVEKLNQEARVTDQQLQDWTTNMPAKWSYEQQRLGELSTLPKAYFFSPEVYCFSCPGAAAVWCQYFAARMIINSTRLKILEVVHRNSAIDSNYEVQRLECKVQLDELIHGLASTLPFCLGRFKVHDSKATGGVDSIVLNTEEINPSLACLPVWPLIVASSLEGIDVTLQKWFRSLLGRLGTILGDGVLVNADKHLWATL